MVMERDAHEGILNQLLNPELPQSERTELLQQLRVDYGSVISEHTEAMQSLEQLQRDNSDLVVSNSKLFRQIGITDTGKEKEEEKVDFSESVTIEALEKNAL